MKNTACLKTLSIVSRLKYEIIRGTFEVQPTGQATKAFLFVPGGSTVDLQNWKGESNESK